MNQRTIHTIILIFIITCMTLITNHNIDNKVNTKFYDGEGNEIPLNIVRLLVQDQFVHLDSNEYKQLDKHFYLRKKKY